MERTMDAKSLKFSRKKNREDLCASRRDRCQYQVKCDHNRNVA